MIITDLNRVRKKFDIIYCDPAWSYNLIGKNFSKNFTKKKTGFDAVVSCEDHYNTMHPTEVAQLPVKNISNKNSLCFMWVTSPLLDQGIWVMQQWGFEYKTVAFVWYKQAIMPGFYTMGECEICIVGKKKGGNIPKPRGARNIRQFISEKRGKHSQKPAEVRRRIELMFPEQTKIELFHRGECPKGWSTWGNQSGLIPTTGSSGNMA
jgi:N6-adenosine-specific RNA methylase IME4